VRLIWGTQLPIAPIGESPTKFGEIGVTYVAQGIFAPSIYRSEFGYPVAFNDRYNLPADLNLTQDFAEPDVAGRYILNWGGKPIVAVTCGVVTTFGEAGVVNAAQGIFAQGFEATSVAVNALIFRAYTNPFVLNVLGQPVDFNLVQSIATERPSIDFTFTFAIGSISPGSVYSGGNGTPTIRNQYEYITPGGFSYRALGNPTTYNLQKFITPNGFSTRVVTSPVDVINRTQPIKPASFSRLAFGTGGSVVNESLGFTVPGFSNRAIGSPTLAILRSYINPTGFTPRAIGSPTTYNLTLFIKPAGYSVRAFGTAGSVVNESLGFTVSGFSDRAFGSPATYNLTSYIKPAGLSPRIFGMGEVTNAALGLTVPGFNNRAFGVPAVENNSLGLTIPGFKVNVFGSPVAYNYNSGIVVRGFVPRAVGTPFEVKNNSLGLVTTGFTRTQFGVTTLHNLRQIKAFTGFRARRIGTPNVLFANNKYIFAAGIDSAKFGNSSIRNYMLFIDPEGFDNFIPGVHTKVSRPTTNNDAMNFTMMLF
jgi:hypothetical protein